MHDDRERLTEALSAYLDGAIDGAERDALERHLATCEDCRAELAGLRQVGVLLRSLSEPTLPRSFTLPVTTTRTGLATTARRAPRWSRAAQWIGGLAAALGAGLLVVGAIQPPSYGAFGTSAPIYSGSFSQGGASSAPRTSSPSHTPEANQSTGTVKSPPPAGTAFGPDQTATPSVTPIERNTGTGSPLVPAGATLLVGGGAALAAGTASRRRAHRNARVR